MMYTPYKGSGLFIETGGVDHLFIVVTDACSNGEHLLLNFSTVKQGVWHDPTCIVEAGVHPFITSQSFVEYRFAQIQSGERLSKMVNGWVYRRARDDVDANLVNSMLAGVTESPFTRGRVKKYVA